MKAGSYVKHASTSPSTAGAATTSQPRPSSRAQKASCCRSSPAGSGVRHPASAQSPAVAGRRTSTRRSGATIDVTPYSTGADYDGTPAYGV